MFQLLRFLSQSLVVLWLFFAFDVFAAARLEPLTVGYSNITATYAPLWIAVEEHVGVKYGLDLKAIYAGRVRPQQLLATGEVPIVVASGTGTMTSHILGIKDQVLVATITSKIGTSLFAKADLKNCRRLEGQDYCDGPAGGVLRRDGEIRSAQ